MNRNPIERGVEEIQLNSWEDFQPFISSRFLHGPAFVYRGQSDFDWQLRSSIDRHEEVYPKRKNLSGGNPEFFNCPPLTHSQQLAAFRHAMRGRRGHHSPELNDDECWALGQHYGLKTPLLDWTLAPFAALFFAFEGNSDSQFRGVYAFSTSLLEKKEMRNRVSLLSPHTDENVRLIGQAGLFLKLPRNEDLESIVREVCADEDKTAYFIKIKIPTTKADRDACLITLNKMNINNMTVYPDLDGAAKHVNSLWQPGYEDLIAWLGRKTEEDNAN
ncbi:FRG domain-containing protein [Aeoliella sp. ICT_H6.2]|uniref:FRG domain-containing protein n=1 Tax=Aeoliella straminimaris TaxID=2954799 RepID=A0A9X2JES7_9BACT|nr:FRG domain-containing protein [Aeoliella straminimaris]MCO6043315.1 FRG domain-containing protein [Aeoliella straminimaris]